METTANTPHDPKDGHLQAPHELMPDMTRQRIPSDPGKIPMPDSTTGSGYSEMEREMHDGTNTDHPADPQHADNGRMELIQKYNINDKAYSDSSEKDFVPTVSKFHHAEPSQDVDSDGDIQV